MGISKVNIYLTNAFTYVIKAPSTHKILLSLQNVLLSPFSVSPTHSQGSHSNSPMFFFFFFFGHLWLVLPILEIHINGIDSICKYRTCENSHVLHFSIDCSFFYCQLISTIWKYYIFCYHCKTWIDFIKNLNENLKLLPFSNEEYRHPF